MQCSTTEPTDRVQGKFYHAGRFAVNLAQEPEIRAKKSSSVVASVHRARIGVGWRIPLRTALALSLTALATGNALAQLEEHQARELIPALKRAGAEGLVEYPLNKVVY